VRLAIVALVLPLVACAQGDTRPSTPGLLPKSFPPYGMEFQRYRAPEFPPQLRATGVASGYSVIAVTIAPDGRVDDALGIEASDQAFIDAVLAVVPEWLFETVTDPPTEPRREVLHYRFRLSGAVSVLTHREGAEAAFAENADDFPRIRTVRWSDMATPPKRLPPEPHSAIAARVQGMAEINFIIDQTGRVRVPAIVEARDWDAALIALDVVESWRFAPPRHEGESVLVEVRARWGD
jgi:outer membrane biosynthesis protein TonB